MEVLNIKRDICHTEAVRDEFGYKLVKVCRDAPQTVEQRETYLCTRDTLGMRCEEISPVSRVDDCGCLCC